MIGSLESNQKKEVLLASAYRHLLKQLHGSDAPSDSTRLELLLSFVVQEEKRDPLGPVLWLNAFQTKESERDGEPSRNSFTSRTPFISRAPSEESEISLMKVT